MKFRGRSEESSGQPGSRSIIFLIVRREVRMRLRSHIFIFVTGLLIVLMAFSVLFINLLENRPSPTRVGFTGPAQALEQPFASALAALKGNVIVSAVADQATGEAQIGKSLDVLISGSVTAPRALVKDQLSPALAAVLNILAQQNALDAQISGAGLDLATVRATVVAAGVSVTSQVPANPLRTQQIVVGFAIAYILMLALSFYGGLIASGVVEEKSSRIVEIILSTVRPTQLLAGKIIGMGLVGLCQLIVLGIAALIIFIPTGVISVPALSIGALLVDLFWFLLGFFFYATIFAAGAALVSRQEDIASVTAPPIILLILSYILVNLVMFDPNSLSSTLLSLLPPFAPVLMVARLAAGNPPLIQLVGAALLTLASTIGLTQVAGRIYANSILRMGARVSFREALRRRAP